MFIFFIICVLMVSAALSFCRFLVLRKREEKAEKRLNERIESGEEKDRLKTIEKNAYDDAGVFFVFVSICLILGALLSTSIAYSNQKKDLEELTRLENRAAIYQNKAKVLTEKFAGYVLEVYPEHEKNIFEMISPDEVNIYLAKYPELQASKPVILLVQQIRQLQDDYYDQQLEKEDVLKDMRFRSVNPWLMYWFIPTIDELQSSRS